MHKRETINCTARNQLNLESLSQTRSQKINMPNLLLFIYFISKESIVLRRGTKIATQDVQERKGNTHP